MFTLRDVQLLNGLDEVQMRSAVAEATALVPSPDKTTAVHERLLATDDHVAPVSVLRVECIVKTALNGARAIRLRLLPHLTQMLPLLTVAIITDPLYEMAQLE